VVRYPELDGRVQVSPGGGHRPQWPPDGDEITYQMASTGGLPESFGRVLVELNDRDPPVIRPGSLELLVPWEFVGEAGGRRYLDVSPDGTRFIALQGPGTGRANREITVVLNWKT